jgi:penicillin-binding protein 1C
MREISGARGPALIMRSIFAHLEGLKEPRNLFQSPRLTQETVCPKSGQKVGPQCPHINELFVPGSEPTSTCTQPHSSARSFEDSSLAKAIKSQLGQDVQIVLPSPGLNLARDPRIPDSHEFFGFELESTAQIYEVTWLVNGKPVATYRGDVRRHLWQLEHGRHTVRARVRRIGSQAEIETDEVEFFVR